MSQILFLDRIQPPWLIVLQMDQDVLPQVRQSLPWISFTDHSLKSLQPQMRNDDISTLKFYLRGQTFPIHFGIHFAI